MGTPMEIERKYLIVRPDAVKLALLPGCTVSEIEQTYLCDDGTGMGRRVRRRSSEKTGDTYTYTRKKTVGFGERIELEDVISGEEYCRLLQEADPDRKTVRKVRYCFSYRKQPFELDVYDFSQSLATLEIELPSIDRHVELPGFLQVLKDVTGEDGYSNFALSEHLCFPDFR